MEKTNTLPRSFWSFYRSLAMRALSEGYGVLDGFLTFITVVLFAATLFSKELARQLESNWQGLSRWYSVLPLVLLFGYRMMKANYAYFEEVVKHADSLNDELKLEQDKLLQPEVGLVWAFPERYGGSVGVLERGSEKFIVVHNRSSEYIHNIQVQPIILDSRVEFDFIPVIAPSKTAEAVGRWDSKGSPGQKNSSLTTNYAYFFADNEETGSKLGWYQEKPHDRGITNAWWKVPITVSYQWRGVTWQTVFEFTYDIGEESWFSLISGKRI